MSDGGMVEGVEAVVARSSVAEERQPLFGMDGDGWGAVIHSDETGV
jgi:hypothetical protein